MRVAMQSLNRLKELLLALEGRSLPPVALPLLASECEARRFIKDSRIDRTLTFSLSEEHACRMCVVW